MKPAIQILMRLIWFVVLLLLILFLLFLGWMVLDLVAEGISSRAIAWDSSTPSEGWDVWRRTQWMNAAPELLLVEAVIGALIFVLMIFLCRLFRRSPKID
jgi:hypothetical protein